MFLFCLFITKLRFDVSFVWRQRLLVTSLVYPRNGYLSSGQMDCEALFAHPRGHAWRISAAMKSYAARKKLVRVKGTTSAIRVSGRVRLQQSLLDPSPRALRNIVRNNVTQETM